MKQILCTVMTAVFTLTGSAAAIAEEARTEKTAPQVVDLMQDQLTEGCLLMHEGDCLAVKMFTRSPYTHVGIVLKDESGNWQTYDSANGEGVRKTELCAYLEECAPNGITLLCPSEPYTEEELDTLRLALEEQIGRPYGIRHHLTGNQAEGVHCSEYVTTALIQASVITAERPSRVSPASLRQGLLESDLYREAVVTTVVPDVIPAPPAESWFKQLWIDTKTCTSDCCKSWNRTIFCCE
ncbi:YiiX/YebB-like N1pC/P60 family cysteine hydrolase [Rubinisphaera margarita]|uniref:YiiX/YebB-like N1pC/P60 family cysteine hydrolase n=1 Tax=Rubinisphaera margarita TaxID=2909586 RepID=UPI001EE7C38B|nr:YiiX/YebB-like N1pC/P60 family cysteine hydrolase [Rubinisphaera margarita]MCG6156028.1 hypothetical protein [Rubinisphaera margarita]